MTKIRVEYEEKYDLKKKYEIEDTELEDLINGNLDVMDFVGGDLRSCHVKYIIYDANGNVLKKGRYIEA